MKKVLKSKIFWVIIIILIIGAFVFRSLNKGEEIEYVTEEVKMGSIIQTVSATGQIKSASKIKLNFKNAGKLVSLNTKVGDEVAAGQVLAQLRATSLSINVNKAQADLSESMANLNKLKAGATQEDVAVSQATVSQAKTDLDNTKATYSQALINEKESILIDINTALTKVNISLQEVYDTLNYKGDSKNFKTSNSVLEQKVNNNYNLSLIKVDEAELAYNLAELNGTDEEIDDAVNKTLTALSKISNDLDDIAELLEYVIITSVLSRTEIGTLKTDINTERTTTNSSLSTLQTAKQDLADARLNYQTKIEEAQKTLDKSEADLTFKLAPARNEDIALYEARVRKSQADLRLTQDKYDETIIRAPISGIITNVNFEIGEQTSLTQPVITMLAVENYEIEVDIPESDIVKIDVADVTEITLDAFTGEDIFKGMVTTINPAQTEIQDVVYYRVTVVFTDDQPNIIGTLMDKIKPGMTANVTVNTARIDDILIIPLRGVKERDGNKVVEILVNEEPQEIIVTLGLKGDEGLVEVKSGLTVGQKVITFVREK